MVFFALALLLIIIVMYLYLSSGILVLATFLNVIFSLGVGYFVYHVIFRFDFFPFTNVMTMILLIAIGADGIFLFYDTWQQAKIEIQRQKDNSDEQCIISDKKYEDGDSGGHVNKAAAETFNENNNAGLEKRTCDHKSYSKESFTSFPESKADIQENQASNDDNINTFKIEDSNGSQGVQTSNQVSELSQNEAQIPSDDIDFSDDLELIMRITFHHAIQSIMLTSLTTAAAMFANFVSKIIVVRLFGIFTMTCILMNFLLMVTWVPCLMVLQEKAAKCSIFPCELKLWQLIRLKVSQALNHLFAELLPLVISKAWYVFIILFVTGGVIGIVAVFVTPKFQLPSSTYFPMFTGDHPFEIFNRDMKQRFEFSNPTLSGSDVLDLYFTWGIKPVDNSDHLNPFTNGYLDFDTLFSSSRPEAQTWMVEFCARLKNESFIHETMRDIDCTYTVFWDFFERNCSSLENQTLTECCEKEVPVESELFDTCLPYNVMLNNITNVAEPTFGAHIFDITNNVKGFSLKISSNKHISPSFDIMDNFYTDLEEYFSNEMETAPEGLKKGFFYGKLQFYDLQANLASGTVVSLGVSMAMALFFIFITTLSVKMSLYSIFTIFLAICVTIGCLLALGWELNIIESSIITIAVGLSIDFVIHYGVAYLNSTAKMRKGKMADAFRSVGMSVSMAALTTFLAGMSLLPTKLVAYRQVGSFLMIVMVISWLYATFLLQSLFAFIGPTTSEHQDKEEEVFYDAYNKTLDFDLSNYPQEIQRASAEHLESACEVDRGEKEEEEAETPDHDGNASHCSHDIASTYM